MENWIDQGQAPSLDAVRAAIDQGNVAAVNIYMGGRFAYLGGPNGNAQNPQGNGWTPAFVQAIATARPQVAFFGSWVSLEPGQGGYNLGFSDGLDAALAALSYPMVRWLSYDVEPGAFDANPQGAADAMRGFTDAVHSKGFLSMPYSVERGLVAGLAGADALWIANPGGEDPAHARPPLTDDIYAGRRSVQCCTLIAAGVDWDLSHSQFSVAQQEEDMPLIIGATGRPAFLLDGKLWVGIADSNDVTALQNAGVKQAMVSPALFDAINTAQTAPPPAVGTVNVDLTPITTRQDALKADFDSLTLKKA